MNDNAKEFLAIARDFLIVGDKEDAYIHYAKVALDCDPQNSEAQFFMAVMSYNSLLNEKDYASAVNAFTSMAMYLKNAVSDVKNSDLEPAAKRLIIKGMVEAYTPVTRFLFKGRISTTSSTIQTGVRGLYNLGNAIKDNFDSDPAAMELAAVAWKEGVALQREFYAYKYDGVNPEDYAAKIQKVEPSYVMPKKAGCVTIG